MIKNIVCLFAVCALLAGCGSGTSTINVMAKPIDIDIARTADPRAVEMHTITFKVINKDNIDSFIQTLSKAQGTSNPVFIAITTKDYENLSLNLADLRRYIEDQRAVIIYYRNLTTHNNSVTSTNTAN